jgi:hypothetical protein
MSLKATLAKLPKPLLVVIAVVALLYVVIVFISTTHENETPSREPSEFLVSVKRFFARTLRPDDLTQDPGEDCTTTDTSFQLDANETCAFTVPPSRRGSKMTLTLTQGSAARVTVQKADPDLATVETNFSAGSQESVDIFPGEATMVVQCLSFSQCTLAVS